MSAQPITYITFSGFCIRETAKAVQIRYEHVDGYEVNDWFPKSQFSSDTDFVVNAAGDYRLQKWLARDKGVI